VFGRSALTEGFTSQNTAVVNSLLEHDSATEEKLLMNTKTPASGQGDEEEKGEEEEEEEDGVTHEFLFLDTPLRVRELPMARGNEGESILGQANPNDDTTGLGIWAASLVMAQWMAHLCKNEDRFRPKKSFLSTTTTTTATTTILELGAGCGLPALTIAKMMAKPATSVKVYASDFNPQTVKNLQYNIKLNEFGSVSKDDDATSSMNDDDDDCKVTNIATSSSMDIDCVQATPATKNATTVAMMMNWQDPTTWPNEQMDFVIGSDLIYQSDMVPLLVQTISRLLKKHTGTFLYCAPETQGRQGHDEFMLLMSEHFTCTMEQSAPARYLTNPLAGQDDDLCYLHFHELQSSSFKLYEFSWKQ
jgi:predicted nicotinamide N-methyase